MKSHNHASNWRGKKASPTYRTWTSIVQRCCNANHKHYDKYKGMLCERWKEFKNFLEDMGERPSGMTIDRISNDKGYTKDNCRWATPSQQVRNRANSLPEDIPSLVRGMRDSGEKLEVISRKLLLNISRVKNIIYRGDYK